MQSLYLKYLFISIFTTLSIISSHSQKPLLSKKFEEKIEAMGVDFYFPIETKVKVKENVKDDFRSYDLILRSKHHFELRYILKPLSDKNSAVMHPHVQLSTLISTLATNDQEEFISIQEIAPDVAQNRFGADWGVYADYVPKYSLTSYTHGRVISLFNSEKGLINCIILHNEETLDGFLGMPLRFVRESEY